MPVRGLLVGAFVVAGLAVSGCAAAGAPAPASAGASPPAAAGASAPAAASGPSGTCHVRGQGRFVLPDPRCTPGAIDPRVTQVDIASTICRRGYTRRVRPPASVTEPEKRTSVASYGDYAGSRMSAYEYDHLIPLELGGAPNDRRNLWPQQGGTPNPKDRLEDLLRRRVCSGALPLAVARREIATNWVTAYRRLIGVTPPS